MNQRTVRVTLPAAGLLTVLTLLAGCPQKPAPAAPPSAAGHPPPAGGGMNYCDFKKGPVGAPVRIVAFYPGRHEDTLAALKQLLEDFPDKVHVEIVDWRRAQGLERRDAAGLTCAGITINGKNAFDLTINGKASKVLFVRGIDGEWTQDDLRAAVKKELRAAR